MHGCIIFRWCTLHVIEWGMFGCGHVHHSIMMNVTWWHFDQSSRQLIVGHTTRQNVDKICIYNIYWFLVDLVYIWFITLPTCKHAGRVGLAKFVDTGDGRSILTLCGVIFETVYYLFIITIFYSEFTYQKNSVNKTTNTKNWNSASMQCCMGLSDKGNEETSGKFFWNRVELFLLWFVRLWMFHTLSDLVKQQHLQLGLNTRRMTYRIMSIRQSFTYHTIHSGSHITSSANVHSALSLSIFSDFYLSRIELVTIKKVLIVTVKIWI